VPNQALADLLKVTHRGYFIPPRPEKNPVEGQRAQQEFVEQRRAALQHYLEQLAAHPVISRSEVRTFLTPALVSCGCDASSALRNARRYIAALVDLLLFLVLNRDTA